MQAWTLCVCGFQKFLILLMWYFKYKLWDCFREITLHLSLNYLSRSEKILLKILPKVHACMDKKYWFYVMDLQTKNLPRETGPLPWEKKTLQSRFEEKSNLKLFVKIELPYTRLWIIYSDVWHYTKKNVAVFLLSAYIKSFPHVRVSTIGGICFLTNCTKRCIHLWLKDIPIGLFSLSE
jgi:hypothetical protein